MSLAAPDFRTLQALASLERSREFELVMGFLRVSREEAVSTLLRRSSQADVMQMQGYCRALDDVISTFGSARAALDHSQSLGGAANT